MTSDAYGNSCKGATTETDAAEAASMQAREMVKATAAPMTPEAASCEFLEETRIKGRRTTAVKNRDNDDCDKGMDDAAAASMEDVTICTLLKRDLMPYVVYAAATM